MSAFVHMELSTNDPTAAKNFYKQLFGWKLTDNEMPNGTYTTFDTRAGGPGGGITAKMDPGQPTAWLPYVGVKSVKKSMEKAKSLGATPVVEYMPIPGYGVISQPRSPPRKRRSNAGRPPSPLPPGEGRGEGEATRVRFLVWWKPFG